jgi:hypothetical protein
MHRLPVGDGLKNPGALIRTGLSIGRKGLKYKRWVPKVYIQYFFKARYVICKLRKVFCLDPSSTQELTFNFKRILDLNTFIY